MDYKDYPDTLNWKICFKKILAPHLLNPSINEEQSNGFETQMPSYPKSVNFSISLPSNHSGRSEIPQKDISLGIEKQSFKTVENNRRFFSDSHHPEFDYSDGNFVNNLENIEETEETIASIINADAEELSKSLKALKVPEKTERRRIAPDWNSAFKKILNPKDGADTTLHVSTLKSCQLQMEDPSFINRWTFHRLSREDCQNSENIELPTQSPSKSVIKRQYTEAEKNVLEILGLSRSFKQREKPHINIFDGAGVNCFKNDKVKLP